MEVRLARRGNRIQAEVEDWGIDFDPSAAKRNAFGLEGIRERAALLGGSTVIDSTPEKGTRIAVQLPLVIEEEAAND